MLTEERQAAILRILAQKHIVKNNDLALELNTSISTIRRDLQELEDAHKLIRIHGGAKLLDAVLAEPSMSEKTNQHPKAKTLIAQAAVKYIKDGDTIFLDAGTTTFAMINHLAHKNITVVTNSIGHAKALSDAKITTYILGGMIKETTQAIIQATANEQLKALHFDCAFLGTNTIHSTFGYMTPDLEEANIKKIAIEQSQKSYILADHSKFEHIAFAQFADLAKATIITDYIPTDCQELFNNQTTIKEINK